MKIKLAVCSFKLADKTKNNSIEYIRTVTMPSIETPGMIFDPGQELDSCKRLLNMKEVAYEDLMSDEELIDFLKKFAAVYQDLI